MSTVGSSSMAGTPSDFLSLTPEGLTGRKSATAAAMTTASAPRASICTAAAISAAVSTATTRAPAGARSLTVVTSTTSAPRATASAAIEAPCLPDERLPTKRTASIGSRVPPAVTSTVRPAKSCGVSAASTAATMSAGSAMRPDPTSPPASGPSTGPTIRTPRAASTATLSWTDGCSHISVCMAGATTTGARVASKVAESTSPERPVRRSEIRRAVAGHTTTTSALWPSAVCGIDASEESHSDVTAGADARAENVVSPTIRRAPPVSTGVTCAPSATSRRHTSTALYAAIPPVTPSTTCRPLSDPMVRSSGAGSRSRLV